MTLPKYTNTNLMIQYLIKIELSLDRIRYTKLPKNYHEKVVQDLHISEIMHLSMLVGEPIGLDEAERVYLGKVLPSARSKHLLYSNYRNALEFAKNYDPRHFVRPSSELILHLNKLVSNRLSEDWESGRFRNFSEKPVPFYDDWYKLRDYYTSVNFEQYFDELLDLLINRPNRIQPTIRYALILYEIIDKAPLLIANQLTSIALLVTLSKEKEFDQYATFPIVKAIQFISKEIVEAYKLSKSRRDVTPFIEAFLYAMSIQIREQEDIYTNTLENKVKKHGDLKDKLNNRQIKALDHLEHTKSVTREEYSKMMGVSFMTAYRDLQDLLKQGFIEQMGVGRGTHYLIKGSPDEEMEDKNTDKEKLEVFSDLD